MFFDFQNATSDVYMKTPDLSLPTEFDESTGWQCTDDFRPSVPLSNIGFKFGLPLDKPLITLAKVYSPFLEWVSQPFLFSPVFLSRGV